MARLPFPDVEQGPLRLMLRELHELHARAGWPSTRELAKGQAFSHVAVHDLLTKATGVPRLPVLLAVVGKLAEAAPSIDVEKALDDFDKMWRECVGDVARPGQEANVEVSRDEPPSREALPRMFERLRDRELQILELLATGLSTQQIASQLYVSSGTARSYIGHIMIKLNVRTRAELLIAYREYLKWVASENVGEQ